MHLASRCAAFQLPFVQRLLYGPQDRLETSCSADPAECWRPRITGMFLMDFKTVDFFSLPAFYRGLFSVWKLLWRQRVQQESRFWLLHEPLAHGGLLRQSTVSSDSEMSKQTGATAPVSTAVESSPGLGRGDQPEWRSLYKPRLSKRVEDLKWKTPAWDFSCKHFNIHPETRYPFCQAVETFSHCFTVSLTYSSFHHVGLFVQEGSGGVFH